jgi:glycosyltransferase involved in cell wall biosynthesis
LLSLTNPAESHDASLRATREYCRQVVTVPSPAFALSRRGKRALQLRSLFSPKSFGRLSHVFPHLLRELKALLSHERFDVVNVEFAQLAACRDAIGSTPDRPLFVLDEHNIEYEVLRRTAAAETGIVRRIYNAIDWRKLRAEELAAWRVFDGCALTSQHDRDLLLRDVPQARTAIVPNAVDLKLFAAGVEPSAEPFSILFFGAINYFPNADGLQFFLSEIFPLVRARLPQARLKVVGHTPEHLLHLRSDHVEMKGWVPDVRVEVERAAAVIAPLRVGGGTRLKILEAMAMGKPVISTPQGAEGLEGVHGRDLLIAERPAAFADELIRVLCDAGLARALGNNARKLAEDRYGWPASVARLEALYLSLGAGSRKAD